MTATTPEAAASYRPLTHRETMWIVLGVLVPVLMASLDQSMVASALPTIGREFGDTRNLSWIVAANLLTMTAATPLYGKFSDTKGRQVTLLFGIGIFMAGAIASALAPNIWALVAARALQGIGSAGLVSMAMTVLGDVAAPKQRARYYTYFSIVYTSAGALGPALGGFYAEYIHWSAVFWTGVPLGIIALLFATTLLGKLPRHERPHKLDILGALLIVAASSTFMFILNAGGKNWPWMSPQIIGIALLSCALWVAFFWRLVTAPEPLIPIALLRNPIVRTSTVANACGWSAIIGLNIYLPLYLQAVHEMSPTVSGLFLMVVMVTVNSSALGGAWVAGRVERYKVYPTITLLICIAAMSWMAYRVDSMSVWEFEIALAIAGLGFGPVAPVTTVATQNAVKLSELGTATSIMSFCRSLVASILITGLGAIILHTVAGGNGGRVTATDLAGNREAAIAAFRWLFWITTGCFVITLIAFLKMEERPLLNSNEGRMG
jgi:MFS family permease